MLVERCVRSLGIIEADPVLNDLIDFQAVSDFIQVNGLLFEGTPEPFDEDVVQVAASAIHRDLISALVSVLIQSEPLYWLP